jgi:hypothetical protein
MAIDRERYEEYRDALQEQMRGLSAAGKLRTLRAKLLRHLADADIDPDDTERVRRMIRELFGEEMSSYVDLILERYDSTVEIVNELYDDIGFDMDRALPRLRAAEAAMRSELGTYKESTIEEITQRTTRGLLQQEGIEEIRQRITPVSDKAARYAQTIARTSVKSYSRTLKSEKARVAGVRHFEYVGIIRSTTRPFCRALVGTTLNQTQVRLSRNGNREPVEAHCGGWNCIHDLEPDPFADRATFSGQWVERRSVRFPGDAAKARTYDLAE